MEYYDVWLVHSGGITPIKLLEVPFWELYNFFRRFQTENQVGTVCQLEITMNAGTPNEYIAKFEQVTDVLGCVLLNSTAGVN